MIKLRFSFEKEQVEDKEFEIVEGELLTAAVDRAIEGIPLGERKASDVFQAVVNGNHIDAEFWPFTALKVDDQVLISPSLKDGDSSQIFKQIVVLAITVVASVYLGPAVGGGIYGALAVAAVSIAANLLMNALIPPPTLGGADLSIAGGLESSQMYSLQAQSNQIKRFESVPKVYGVHRVYPNVAAAPYSGLEVDPGTGELVEYLYVVYDFGFGPMTIQEIMIGDTPLTNGGFTDFFYRFVDFNKPAVSTGPWDDMVFDDLQFYKGDSQGDSLAVSLDGNADENDPTDTWHATRNTATNTFSDAQAITLNFVNPTGLYGYASNGARDYRQIEMKIFFRLVGSSAWRGYNDPLYVSAFSSVGAQANEFELRIKTTPTLGRLDTGWAGDALENQYLTMQWLDPYNYGTGRLGQFMRAGQPKFILETFSFQTLASTSNLIIGHPVYFRGSQYLGNILSYELAPDTGYTIVTLDRNIPVTTQPVAIFNKTNGSIGGGTVYAEQPGDTGFIDTTMNGIGRFRIKRNETAPAYSSVTFTPNDPGEYEVRVQRDNTSGPYNTTVADKLTWTSIVTRFDRAPIVTDKRHVFMELKIKATSQLNGTVSNLSAVCASAVDVWNGSAWVKELSSNPAWVFADLLTSEVNKKAISKDRLHVASLLEWAEFCDAVPDNPPDHEYIFPRFKTNFVLDYATTLQGVLQQVASAAQASLNIIDGKYGVLVDRYRSTPVQIFTPRNSRDFSSVRNYGPRPHGVRVKYIDPDVGWSVSEIIAYDDGYGLEADEDTDTLMATDIQDLTSFACTNNEQAWRFGRYMIAQNKLRQETINILVDFEHLVCTRGDFVQITQDVMRVGGTPARVKLVDGDEVEINDSVDLDIEFTPAVQHFTFLAVPDHGAFKLNFGSLITDFIQWNSTAFQVEDALRQLEGLGNVGVTGTPGDYVITFTDWNAITPLLVVSNNDMGVSTLVVTTTAWVTGPQYGYTYRAADGTIKTSTLDAVNPHRFILYGEIPAVGDLFIVGQVGQIVFDCIVKAISPNDDMSANLQLIEKADAVYDYESSGTIPDYDPLLSDTSNPEFKPPREVTELTVADFGHDCNVSDTGYEYFVDLIWGAPEGTIYEFFAVYVDNGRGGYLDVGHTVKNQFHYVLDEAQLGIEHSFKVLAVSASGRKLELGAVTAVVATVEAKTEPPSDVERLSMDIINQVLQLSWPQIADCDVKEYLIRYSPSTTGAWGSSTILMRVSAKTTMCSVQARTGTYLIKAYDFNGNQSETAATAITTIPNLFQVNAIESLLETDFDGRRDRVRKTGTGSIVNDYTVVGGVTTAEFYPEAFYYYSQLLDLGDIYSVSLQSRVRAAGYATGSIMSEWESLEDVLLLETTQGSQWDVETQYRSTENYNVMSEWDALSDIDVLNEGDPEQFTEWRTFYRGDATGRVFQFRLRLLSFATNVSPRVFDGLIEADMPDRTETYENLVATVADGYVLTYDVAFKGPAAGPNVQVSIDGASAGDYWTFDYRTINGLLIRFFDINDNPVERQFDLAIKGFGHKYSAAI